MKSVMGWLKVSVLLTKLVVGETDAEIVTQQVGTETGSDRQDPADPKTPGSGPGAWILHYATPSVEHSVTCVSRFRDGGAPQPFFS